jgi:hypothetical protein
MGIEKGTSKQPQTSKAEEEGCMSVDTQYETTDLWLAAFLVYAGYKVVRVTSLGREDAIYIFEAASFDLESDLETYDAGQAAVADVKTYGRAIGYLFGLRGLARNHMGDFSPGLNQFKT